MKSLNMFSRNSLAASPVIGVMLMVVVTVILAAAVSSYSNSIGKSAEVPPSASFDVDIRKDISTSYGNMSYMTITEVTGEKIPTSELEIRTINPNARGNQTRIIRPNSNNTNTLSFEGTSPFWNKGNFPVTGQFFGEFIMEPGMTMVADEYANYYGAIWDEDTGEYITDPEGHMTGMQAMFADWGDDPEDPSDDSLRAGDVVTIKIVHTPTKSVIFKKDVVISE